MLIVEPESSGEILCNEESNAMIVISGYLKEKVSTKLSELL